MSAIAGLGELEDDGAYLVSRAVRVACLRNRRVQFLFEDGADDPAVHAMIGRFLAAGPEALAPAEPFVRQYRADALALAGASVRPVKDIWKHVGLPDEIHVHVDEGVAYLSLECNVAWDDDHGMQLVLDGDLRVVKVGPFDGHLTNAAAYDDPKLAGVVYRPLR